MLEGGKNNPTKKRIKQLIPRDHVQQNRVRDKHDDQHGRDTHVSM